MKIFYAIIFVLQLTIVIYSQDATSQSNVGSLLVDVPIINDDEVVINVGSSKDALSKFVSELFLSNVKDSQAVSVIINNFTYNDTLKFRNLYSTKNNILVSEFLKKSFGLVLQNSYDFNNFLSSEAKQFYSFNEIQNSYHYKWLPKHANYYFYFSGFAILPDDGSDLYLLNSDENIVPSSLSIRKIIQSLNQITKDKELNKIRLILDINFTAPSFNMVTFKQFLDLLLIKANDSGNFVSIVLLNSAKETKDGLSFSTLSLLSQLNQLLLTEGVIDLNKLKQSNENIVEFIGQDFVEKSIFLIRNKNANKF